MMGHRYDGAFYDRAEQSQVAARIIIPIIKSFTHIESVLDVGCARGTWLASWVAEGCRDYVGIDGAYVRRDALVIDPALFVEADLTTPFDLGRQFDFLQCLEVAEHLPRSRSETFVADLVRHADVILFSAAPPGQGGEHHINEQPYDLWRKLFAAHGYEAIDCLRPRLAVRKDLPFWYRYNPILYVRTTALAKLNPDARVSRLSSTDSIRDVSPLSFRVRKWLLRLLPQCLIDHLARLNAKIT